MVFWILVLVTVLLVTPVLFGWTFRPERADVAYFWASGKTAKSARTLRNPNEYAGLGEKKPTGGPVGFDIWWRTVDCLRHKFLSQIAMQSNAAGHCVLGIT